MAKNRQDELKHSILNVVLFLLFLYLFLVSIELLGYSFKLLGRGFAEGLLSTTSNPFIGLLLGILATSIIQSSSATTSIVVGMVAAGQNALPLANAIPIIMGANIGTTITNIIVSIGHITRPNEFRRAFAGATVHDFFNILSVAIFLPLELTTHYLEHTAWFLQGIFAGIGGFTIVSPLKTIVKPAVKIIEYLVGLISNDPKFIAITCIIIALTILFYSLSKLVKLMKSVIIGKVERLLHNYLFSNAFRSFTFGILLTALVQSSSVVTSLVVPLVGAGILTIEQIFPYNLGANIGTTVTAMLASLVTQSPAAIATAFVHLLFNISGTILWFPLRKVPIAMAKWFGEIAYKRRVLAIVYIIIVFYVFPLTIALIIK
ncbi:Na/Pi symporter [bacterium]|nr:Na/Pi symporter [bacterium]